MVFKLLQIIHENTCYYSSQHGFSDLASVEQVAMTTLRRWFDMQHPSDNEAYNAPDICGSLPDVLNVFELTLNDDHGAQYIETHQLANPPVELLTAQEAAQLSRWALRHKMLGADEYARAEVLVDQLVRQAQVRLSTLYNFAASTLTACCTDSAGAFNSQACACINVVCGRVEHDATHTASPCRARRLLTCISSPYSAL